MSAHCNDGGPAFPLAAKFTDAQGDAVAVAHGMTLRDWYATYAPEAPDWFVDSSVEQAPSRINPALYVQTLPGYKSLSKEARSSLGAWMRDGTWDLEGAEAVLANEATEAATRRDIDIARIERSNAARRFFAWRWHYADQMLAGRTA